VEGRFRDDVQLADQTGAVARLTEQGGEGRHAVAHLVGVGQADLAVLVRVQPGEHARRDGLQDAWVTYAWLNRTPWPAKASRLGVRATRSP